MIERRRQKRNRFKTLACVDNLQVDKSDTALRDYYDSEQGIRTNVANSPKDLRRFGSHWVGSGGEWDWDKPSDPGHSFCEARAQIKRSRLKSEICYL